MLKDCQEVRKLEKSSRDSRSEGYPFPDDSGPNSGTRRYCSKPEKWYYLETTQNDDQNGLKKWLMARTVGLPTAWNRLLQFHFVRSGALSVETSGSCESPARVTQPCLLHCPGARRLSSTCPRCSPRRRATHLGVPRRTSHKCPPILIPSSTSAGAGDVIVDFRVAFAPGRPPWSSTFRSWASISTGILDCAISGLSSLIAIAC